MKKAAKKDKKVIRISNKIAELERINQALEILAEKWSLDPKIVFEFNLVLEEMITNIIFYAYKDKREHEIEICLSNHGKRIIIELIDDGIPFDPIKAELPVDVDKPLEDRKIGGLGIHLVKKLMDKVSYSREDDKNILTLEKKL